VAGLSVPLAQVGHVLAYGFRVSESGVHLYFPLLLKATTALVGAGLLVVLAILVLAHLLSGKVARRRPWSFALLACGLLAGQLAVFLIQESLESRVSPNLAGIATGLLAQQPVALVAAAALHWLSARMGPALEAVAEPWRPQTLAAPFPLLISAQALTPAPLPLGRPRIILGQRAPPA
jgi:hypothetical protein